MKRSTIFILLVVSLLVLSGCSSQNKTDLAKCLTKSDVKMYGAFWCPHCSDQKKEFGSAFKYVDYVECDPRGDNARVQLCEDADINGYPTWVFPDSSRIEGKVPLDVLAARSGCPLPQ